MPPAVPEFHPEASKEFLAAVRWYAERNADAAGRFVREVERAVRLIADAPERWPFHDASTRRFVLRKFPYSIIYLPGPPQLFVVAVAHQKRRPGYWHARVPK